MRLIEFDHQLQCSRILFLYFILLIFFILTFFKRRRCLIYNWWVIVLIKWISWFHRVNNRFFYYETFRLLLYHRWNLLRDYLNVFLLFWLRKILYHFTHCSIKLFLHSFSLFHYCLFKMVHNVVIILMNIFFNILLTLNQLLLLLKLMILKLL